MQSQDLQKYDLPDSPGVYFFQQGKDILYIGKATSLRDRVRSYFGADLIHTRGPHIVDMVFKADTLTWQETDSVLEALLLEAELIKKYQTYYNTKERDDKSFLCIVITNEAFPRVLAVRKKDIDLESKTVRIERGRVVVAYENLYGPYPNGSLMREALRIIRRLFPFRDATSLKKDNQEFYKQIGLLPDVTDKEAQSQYQQTIRHLKLFFSGQKQQVLKELEKQMNAFAKKELFEQALRIRNQIFALTHIKDVSLISDDSLWESGKYARSGFVRFEAFDVAHTSGKELVGVMTVIEHGRINKDEYRQFILDPKIANNDTRALDELLSRRFKHTEWGLPDVVIVDGSIAQIRVAKRVLSRFMLELPVVGVTKDEYHKPKEIRGDTKEIQGHESDILKANSEAHRFAISLHRKRLRKNLLA